MSKEKAPIEDAGSACAESAPWIRLLGWAALVGGLLQALKTISFPNLWAATHLNFDYHFGFMKRALLGTLLRGVGFDMGKYSNVMLVGYGALAAAFGALLWFGRCAGMRRTTSAAFLGAVFWSSWAVGYSVHTVAYFDHVLLLLALGSIALLMKLPRAPGVAAAAVLGVVGIMIHENYAVVYSPLVFVCLLLQRRYIGCGVFLAAMIATVLVVLQLGMPNELTKAELVQHYRAVMEYGIRSDAFDVFFRDAAANFAQIRERWTYREHWASLALSLIVFLSAGTVLVCAALSAARKYAEDALHGRLLLFAIPAAALAPLLLHVFAWDMHRWNGMVVVNAFVLLCLVQRCAGEAVEFSGAARWRYYHFGVFAVFLGLASGFGLFDYLEVANAPFIPHVDYLLDVMGGEAEFPRVPLR